MGRCRTWLIGLFAALFLPSLVQAQAAPERIVAVGDLHGDHQAFATILQAAGVMDARGRWTGGRTVLVQTGDIVDRGPDSLKIIEQLMRLQREAPRAGGRVVVITGNHEAMMVTGDLRYVHPGEYSAFVTPTSARLREALYEQQRAAVEAAARARDPKLDRRQIRDAWMAQTPLGLVEHQLAWAPTGRLGRWTLANPVIAKIGGTLFVHGGLSAEYSAIPLAEINRRAVAELTSRSTAETALINDPLGPLWYRGLVTRRVDPAEEGDGPKPPPNPVQVPQRPTIEQELTQVLAATGAQRIVVGHTPSLRGIVIDHGGRLVRIDTGISRHYGGPLSWLEILGDRLVPHTVPRPPQARENRP